MEKKLGETFLWNRRKLKVVEVENIDVPCVGCFFFVKGRQCYFGDLYPCTEEDRQDHTNVIFKEQLNTEEL